MKNNKELLPSLYAARTPCPCCCQPSGKSPNCPDTVMIDRQCDWETGKWIRQWQSKKHFNLKQIEPNYNCRRCSAVLLFHYVICSDFWAHMELRAKTRSFTILINNLLLHPQLRSLCLCRFTTCHIADWLPHISVFVFLFSPFLLKNKSGQLSWMLWSR